MSGSGTGAEALGGFDLDSHSGVVGLIVLAPGRRIGTMCSNCETLLGCRAEEVTGRSIEELVPGLPWPAPHESTRDGVTVVFEPQQAHVAACGGVRLPIVTHAFLESFGGVWREMLVIDATGPRPAHRAQAQSLLQAIEQTADSVMVTDARGTITYVNQGFERQTGYAREEVLGRTPAVLKSGLHTRDFYELLWRTILSGEPFRGLLVNRRKDGELMHEEKTITPIRRPGGAIQSFVSTARDVTERVRSEERMRVLANMDALTGLPNRNLFLDRLHQALARSRRHGARGALLAIDLDQFRAINDTHGHETGDVVMVRLAHALRAALRDADTLARTGGDEFGVLVEEVGDPAEAVTLARKLLALCRQPIDIESRRHFVSCSIGIALFPDHGGDASGLLRSADIALYRAKAAGRDGVQLFDRSMALAITERSRTEALLREALARSEYSLRYQPQVELRTGRVIGVEALLRWHNPQLGDVAPATFIPMLEESSQIVEVGAWVLRRAIEEVRAIGGLAGGARLTVNISPRQFHDPGFVALAREALRLARDPYVQLEFEITESLLMRDIEQAAETIRQVSALGIRFAIDDFGTGYSSLAYVQRFPLHVLKIDRSFIAHCTGGGTSEAIIRTIVRLARALGLVTVAEGVETAEQARVLEELGCDAAQGWLLRGAVSLQEAILPGGLRG